MTKLEKILKRIAKKMDYDDLDFLMEAVVVLYHKMMYGDWQWSGVRRG